MRVAIVADTGDSTTYNLEVDARLDSAVHRLRGFGAEVVAIVDDPSTIPAQEGLESTSGFGFAPGPGSRAADRRRRRLEELQNQSEDLALWAEAGTGPGVARSALVQADAVLLCGGRLEPARPSLLFSRLAALGLATRNAIPAVISSQCLAPLLSETTSVTPTTTGTLRLVGVSDERSFDAARHLFGDIPIRLQVDDAVTLSEEEPEGVPGLDDCRASGYVVVATWHLGHLGPRDMVSRLAGLVEHIGHVTGRRVVFIPISDGRMPAGPEPRLERALDEAVDDPTRIVCCPPLSARHVAWIVRRADSLVTSSQVPLVCGLGAGVPSLALYTDETSAVAFGSALARAGLPGWRLPIDATSTPYASAVFTELWRRRDDLADSAGRTVKEWADSLDRHWEEVWECLSSPDRRERPHPVRTLHHALDAGMAAAPSTGGIHEINELMQAQYGRHDRAEHEWSEVFEQAEEYALDLEAAYAERTKELVSLHRHLDAVDSDRQKAARAAEDGWVLKDDLEGRLAESERLRVLAEARQVRAEDEAERAGRSARHAHELIAGLNARLARQAQIQGELQQELRVTAAALQALVATKTFRWMKPLRTLYGVVTGKRHRLAAPIHASQDPGAER